MNKDNSQGDGGKDQELEGQFLAKTKIETKLIRRINKVLGAIIFSIFGIIVNYLLFDRRGIYPNSYLWLIAIIAFLSVLFVFIVNFLSYDDAGRSDNGIEVIDRVLRDKMRSIALMQRYSSEHFQSFSHENKMEKDVASAIIEKIESQGYEDVISRLRCSIERHDFQEKINFISERMIDRINREIRALGRRGTINLSLGVVMAISGAVFLGYMAIFRVGYQSHGFDVFMIEFLPRLSVVVIIEVFSYFFLRLYKAGLMDIKYFQNEATNIESSLLALSLAVGLNNENGINLVMSSLLAVDRNKPIEKGATTKEIEDAKLFKDANAFSVNHLIEILKAFPRSKVD